MDKGTDIRYEDMHGRDLHFESNRESTRREAIVVA
jgi:hypothetical protein